MLEKGFHQSFSELFSLVERQRDDHQRAGPAAILLEPLIENDLTKLEHLRVQVCNLYTRECMCTYYAPKLLLS
jgi:hypothetical protein